MNALALAFTNLAIANVGFALRVCTDVRPCILSAPYNSSAPNGRIFVIFYSGAPLYTISRKFVI